MLLKGVDMYWVGMFLRFGIPLGFTLMLTWFLKNIDVQWLEEAYEDNTVVTDTPCEIHGCWIQHNLSQENSQNRDPNLACWKVRVKFEGILPDDCIDCEYFESRILENAA